MSSETYLPEERTKDLTEISRALAVLVAEQDSYSYVDKISYAPSVDLAIYYIREALRDLHSLIRGGSFENKLAKKEANRIRYDAIDRALNFITSIRSRKDLREVASLVAAKALSISAKLKIGASSTRGGESE